MKLCQYNLFVTFIYTTSFISYPYIHCLNVSCSCKYRHWYIYDSNILKFGICFVLCFPFAFVFVENHHPLLQGTEVVQGIFLSLPKKEKLHLSVDPILKMDKLRLLKFQNVEFPECVGYLPNELRLLEWHGYPQKSMPSSFCPNKLVELNMSSSRIERLWKETRVRLFTFSCFFQ